MGNAELKTWRDFMIGEAGDLLLDAARRCLGPVKTPFNKHQVAASLEAWLRRPETISALLGSLSSLESRILVLLHFCGPLSVAMLASFAAEGSSNSGQRLVSLAVGQLQDRLLLYCKPDAGRTVIARLTPVLHEKLAADFDLSQLFSASCSPLEQLPVKLPPSLWQRCLCLISVAMHERQLFRRPGVLAKKARTLLETLHQGFSDTDADQYAALATALVHCGVFVQHDETVLLPEPQLFLQLAATFGGRSPLLILAAHEPMGRIPLPLTQAASLLGRILELIPDGVLFPLDDVRRLILVALCAGSDGSSSHNSDAYVLAEKGFLPADGLGGLDLLASVDAIVETLEISGLLLPLLKPDTDRVQLEAKNGTAPLVTPALAAADAASGPRYLSPAAKTCLLAAAASAAPPDPTGAYAVIEESHEVQLLPGADPVTQAWVALMARPQKVDLVWTGLLDKASAIAAFGFGYQLDEYCRLWQLYTGKVLPQSLRFSFESWYKEFSAVRLRQGIVVVLDEHFAWTLEHARKADTVLKEKLAPGVFLLNSGSLAEAERQLAALGIHTDLRGQANRNVPPVLLHDSPVRLSVEELYRAGRDVSDGGIAWAASGFVWPENFDPDHIAKTARARDAAVQERINSLLDKLDSMQYDVAVSEVLSQKIRSRQLIDEAQLLPRGGPTDIVAGAMDYPGKIRLLERSIKEKLPVELVWTDSNGSKNRITCLVRTLAKDEDGMTVEAETLGQAVDKKMVPVRLLAKVRLLLGL